MIFGNRFDRWGLSFRIDVRSGRPYTPDTGSEQEVEPNSGRRPWVHTLDARFRKDFDFVGNMTGSFYIDAINIYNRRNVFRVNSETGTVFGPPLPDGRIPPSNLDPERFGAPLNIIIGFGLRF